MNKVIKILLAGFALLNLGLLGGFQIKSNIPGGGGTEVDSGLRKLQNALLFIENNYVESPQNDKLIDDAIRGIMEGLDPHSFYIPKEEMLKMEENMGGSFEGIGVQFDILDDTIYVETPLTGGPSEKLGIKAGDRIVKVNGETVAGIGITNADVTKYLKGPKGTTVDVSILRRGEKDLLEFEILRDKIPINSVEDSYMIREDIGYLRITRFAETTYMEFRQHMQKLIEQGMKGLILDLRSNPGGYLQKANKIADEFLPAGKLIVSTEGRIAQSKLEYHSTSAIGSFEEGAVIVLIDYSSASASEIVAGALQDHDRGLIVGVRSFGKGLVQYQKDFEDGSAIRLVISKYYTPSGRCIQKPYDKSSEDYEKDLLRRFESGEIFDQAKIQLPDSLKYTTANGRTVYGGGGILPDIFVADDTTGSSRYLTDLRINDLFREFSFHYVDNRPHLKQRYKTVDAFVNGFQVTDDLVQKFTSFAEEKGVPYSASGYERAERRIVNRIKAYIGRRMLNDDAFYPVYHELDNVIQEAIRLMPDAKKMALTGTLD